MTNRRKKSFPDNDPTVSVPGYFILCLAAVALFFVGFGVLTLLSIWLGV